MEPLHFLVIGAINVDIIGTSRDSLVMEDSNPGEVHVSVGGVGCNIARNLGQMGYAVNLLSILAYDPYLPLIKSTLYYSQVTYRGAILNNETNSIYMATHNVTGELSVSINAMTLLDQLTPSYISKWWPTQSYPWVIMDTNLPEDSLRWIAHNRSSYRIAADAVSTFKVTKLRSILSSLSVLKCNREEARILSGLRNHVSDHDVARALVREGVELVLMTRGQESTLVATLDGVQEYPIIPVQHIVSAVGAGDAFLAGFLGSYAETNDIEVSIQHAQKLARITLLSPQAVHPRIDSHWREYEEHYFRS